MNEIWNFQSHNITKVGEFFKPEDSITESRVMSWLESFILQPRDWQGGGWFESLHKIIKSWIFVNFKLTFA